MLVNKINKNETTIVSSTISNFNSTKGNKGKGLFDFLILKIGIYSLIGYFRFEKIGSSSRNSSRISCHYNSKIEDNCDNQPQTNRYSQETFESQHPANNSAFVLPNSNGQRLFIFQSPLSPLSEECLKHSKINRSEDTIHISTLNSDLFTNHNNHYHHSPSKRRRLDLIINELNNHQQQLSSNNGNSSLKCSNECCGACANQVGDISSTTITASSASNETLSTTITTNVPTLAQQVNNSSSLNISRHLINPLVCSQRKRDIDSGFRSCFHQQNFISDSNDNLVINLSSKRLLANDSGEDYSILKYQNVLQVSGF